MDENQIKKEFEKLHQFLRDEEEKQIRSLRKEKVTSRWGNSKSRIKSCPNRYRDLSEKMAAVWQDMEAETSHFFRYRTNTQPYTCQKSIRELQSDANVSDNHIS